MKDFLPSGWHWYVRGNPQTFLFWQKLLSWGRSSVFFSLKDLLSIHFHCTTNVTFVYFETRELQHANIFPLVAFNFWVFLDLMLSRRRYLNREQIFHIPLLSIRGLFSKGRKMKPSDLLLCCLAIYLSSTTEGLRQEVSALFCISI